MIARRPGAFSGLPDDAPECLLAGRYELAEQLGSGGAADVVRAVDLPLRRPVAVKVFRPGADPALEAGFAEEAALLARLQHPGLVTVYDAGVHDGRPFLVMQLIEGTTLRQRLQDGPLTPPEVRRLGALLAHALTHVHDTGIVHRDVKPSNILLDTEGRPYLTDFGIARLADATTRTDSGMFTGTAAYMSPEQVRGDRPGPPSDVYALGLVLLECLTGELEYPGTPLESAVARLHRAPEIPGGTPDTLRELLTAMTATEPEDRPDARTCARWLAPDHTAPGAVPLPKLPRQRGPRRHLTARAPLATLGAVVGVLAVSLTLTAVQTDPDRGDRRSPAPTAERGKPTSSGEERTGPSPAEQTPRSTAPRPRSEASGSPQRTPDPPGDPLRVATTGTSPDEKPKAGTAEDEPGGKPEHAGPPADHDRPGPPAQGPGTGRDHAPGHGGPSRPR
jgi:serine/threonine protein kinase